MCPQVVQSLVGKDRQAKSYTQGDGCYNGGMIASCTGGENTEKRATAYLRESGEGSQRGGS